MTEVAAVNPNSITVFEYPSIPLGDKNKTKGVTPYIVGFENDEKDGTGQRLNIILSNGKRSTQRDEDRPTKYDIMLPVGAYKNISSVDIYYSYGSIDGFVFFDKDKSEIFEIGLTTYSE